MSSSGAKVTWADETPRRSVIVFSPAASAAFIAGPSTPRLTSRRGPVAGVNGTEACSFG